jgi:hypothetical protein
MRQLVLAVILTLTMPLAATGQREVVHRAELARDASVRIHNMVGSVRVTGWDQDSLVVTGTVRETKGEPFGFFASRSGAKLGIWDASTPDVGPSHLDVRVPATSVVWIKTASADVIVSGMTGSIDIYAVSGRIEVTGAPGDVNAESLSGEVRIAADARSVRAKTATGPLALRGNITEASATSVSGDIAIEGAVLERGRFETVDGDIRYVGAIGAKSSLDFVTHAGAVEFLVPRSAAADFVVSTYEGGFEDRYGVSARRTGSSLKGHEIRFTIGGAGIAGQVNVRSFKGRVVLGAK